MVRYNRSDEDYCCNSINNKEHENLPNCSCSISDAVVLLLSDLPVFADDDNDINAHDLQVAQDSLLLYRLKSPHQENNSCNSRRSSFVSETEVQGSIYSPNMWDN